MVSRAAAALPVSRAPYHRITDDRYHLHVSAPSAWQTLPEMATRHMHAHTHTLTNASKLMFDQYTKLGYQGKMVKFSIVKADNVYTLIEEM